MPKKEEVKILLTIAEIKDAYHKQRERLMRRIDDAAEHKNYITAGNYQRELIGIEDFVIYLETLADDKRRMGR